MSRKGSMFLGNPTPWKRIRSKINSLRLNLKARARKKALSGNLEKNEYLHLIPSVQCNHRWYGSSYGGFYINPSLLDSDSVIYSFGIGKDVSFDKTCIKRHGCEVFGFDPTPKSTRFLKENPVSPQFHYHPYGITDGMSGEYEFYLPANPKGVSGSLVHSPAVNPDDFIKVQMKSFEDIITALGHHHIDVLKMDIEGSEYEVLKKILNTDVTIDQILVEFHDRFFKSEVPKSREIVNIMEKKGYRIFAASESYEEISFIRTDQSRSF